MYVYIYTEWRYILGCTRSHVVYYVRIKYVYCIIHLSRYVLGINEKLVPRSKSSSYSNYYMYSMLTYVIKVRATFPVVQAYVLYGVHEVCS